LRSARPLGGANAVLGGANAVVVDDVVGPVVTLSVGPVGVVGVVGPSETLMTTGSLYGSFVPDSGS
jgi:hypothetical protein